MKSVWTDDLFTKTKELRAAFSHRLTLVILETRICVTDQLQTSNDNEKWVQHGKSLLFNYTPRKLSLYCRSWVFFACKNTQIITILLLHSVCENMYCTCFMTYNCLSRWILTNIQYTSGICATGITGSKTLRGGKQCIMHQIFIKTQQIAAPK